MPGQYQELHREEFALGAITAGQRTTIAVNQNDMKAHGGYNAYEFTNSSGQTLRLEHNQKTDDTSGDVLDGKRAYLDPWEGIVLTSVSVLNRGAADSTADAATTPVRLILKVMREVTNAAH